MTSICEDCKDFVLSCYSCDECHINICKDCKKESPNHGFVFCMDCDFFHSHDTDFLYKKSLRNAHCNRCGISWNGFAQCPCEQMKDTNEEKEENQQQEEKEDDENDYYVE